MGSLPRPRYPGAGKIEVRWQWSQKGWGKPRQGEDASGARTKTEANGNWRRVQQGSGIKIVSSLFFRKTQYRVDSRAPLVLLLVGKMGGVRGREQLQPPPPARPPHAPGWQRSQG